jgi:predicted glycoside hydrolase/deacetylase ChbG (UPF0249 family)
LRRLIINADDFGLTAGVSEGIAEAMLRGVVSATTAMVCSPDAHAHVAPRAAELSGRVGLHLQLTDGVPCAEPELVPSLLQEGGRFPRSWRDLSRLNPDEVRREWRAQVERLAGWGVRPAHFDSHHHVHRFPVAFEVYCELARDYDVPARSLSPQMTARLRERGVRCADFCETGWYDGALTVAELVGLVEQALARGGGRGTVELMCHPGYADAELAARSKYVEQRERELRTLCSVELAAELRALQIEVVGTSALLEHERTPA